ncbi:uncharacterized protein Z520_11090 [Fonsecaea multimorphosa CBS 102226]|uniref:F-box domain-containing protein n=1 Tax=Fonsecaea multimorphosa CBS 102226 TaxID=1442371 RepID=A0A0D2GUL2_9EURO|nr:uncharacterized protein Z520_11090 [Fonsecaea multimorphosa CBS 102226]KIX93235.1 hypothetical protein Z520_11090 [Fonsecaea multimorphosa CBS 102226]OAL18467.1 hypothetical protein AYO22_10663 [Fonsecaea multimorphosa]
MAAPGLFDLPAEIRLQIYGLVFGHGKAVIEAKNEDDSGSLMPQLAKFENHSQRSSQLLRANKTILLEARPVLYSNTVFHVINHAFAGKLPTRITDGHPCAPHIKHLVWQLDCDMLKHFYPEDLRLDLGEVARWSSLEIRCRAETWRNSFLGEWCDREAFVRGRAQILEYAQVFHHAMSRRNGGRITFAEDRSQLGRGRIILRLNSGWVTSKQQRSLEELLIIGGPLTIEGNNVKTGVQ